MGLASRAMDNWRERKTEMTFQVNGKGLVFFYNLIVTPAALPLGLMGERAQHYHAKDQIGARDIISLQVWLRRQWKERDLNKQQNDDTFTEFILKKHYIKRVLEMLDHYKALGDNAITGESYWNLRDPLEGRTTAKEIDDPGVDTDELPTPAAEPPTNPPAPKP
jgi:hypothetical protein